MRDQLLFRPPLHRRIQIEHRNMRSLKRAVKDVQPHVVSVWHMSTLSFALLGELTKRALPLVLVVCDDWLIDGPSYDQWLDPFTRHPRAARLAHLITRLPTSLPRLGPHVAACFVSEWVRRRAQELSSFTLPFSTVVYSGIDTADFPQSSRPVDGWHWKMLYVGRPDIRKGIHRAVESLAHLPHQATLRVIGRGDDKYSRSLRERAESLGVADRVTFGYVPRSELQRHYSEADALVFPGIWDEPLGLVPIEAMACGTPVIATGTGGSAEYLIDEVNCLIVPRDDEKAIAAAFERLASDPQLRRRLVEGGLRTAGVLNVDRLAEVLESWHVAAEQRFASGPPPTLSSPIDRIAVPNIDHET